jgi:hypothetical protein
MNDGPPTARGARIVRVAWWGTGLFAVTAVAGAVSDGIARDVAAVVAVGLFGVGIVLFFVAYARAVSRSRFDAVNVGGVYLLLGTAPRAVQLRLTGALALQLVVAVVTAAATASVRPFTPLAFGLLVPMFGLACCGMWGAYHGAFPARTDPRASLPADD